MVGSYPRPAWFHHQLAGRDIFECFKQAAHAEAFDDAVRAVIGDQERAGLDVVTDGQMHFDDYTMGIGSFIWYWFERVRGFGTEKLPHPYRERAKGSDVFLLDELGCVRTVGTIERGPARLAELYRIAARHATRPVKASVGAGPVQLSTCVQYGEGPIKDRYALAEALSPIFAAEIKDLVAAGCRSIQYEDLGAWIPNLSGEKDYVWVKGLVDRTLAGAGVKTSWHFCLGNAWGNKNHGLTAGGYARALPRYFDSAVDEFVLDFACREMEDASLLADLPQEKTVSVGVIDVRSLEIEQPEQVAERVRKVLRHIPPERVTLTTDCGMKQLPRPVAREKLRALVAGAEIVRCELEGRNPDGDKGHASATR
jgi:5-methyltetrahydropteroyltriglutamate--homocysteine methyltransferase